MAEESNVGAIVARKEFLFKELCRIHDLVKKKDFKDQIDAEVQLALLARLEINYNELVKETLTVNTTLPKGKEIKVSDFDAFQSLFDAIRKYCFKCKFSQASTSTTAQLETIRLPRISLPVFSGEIGEWNAFIGQYNATVHVKNISSLEKLTFLRSVLRKEPLAIVNQYELQEDSYKSAYDALVRRYSNPRLLANYYLNQILGFKQNTFQSGKQFIRFMETHVAATSGLLNLKIDNLADYLLFELSYRNLPIHQQKLFDKEVDVTSTPSLAKLINHVETLAKTEELHADYRLSGFKENVRGKSQQVLVGTAENAWKACPNCKQDHPLFRCKSFSLLPLPKRLQIIKSHGSCSQCLGSHKGTCQTKYSCKNCHSKDHHTFLCSRPNQNSAASVLVAPHSSTKEFKEDDSTTIKQRLCNTCLSNKPSTVLLGTIQAQILDLWGRPHDVRIVCDTGSQVNIITNSMVKRLGLKRLFSRFEVQGVSRSSSKALGSVHITLKKTLQRAENKNATYDCTAVVLKSICGELPENSELLQLPEHIKTLQLADPEFNQSKAIDILFGAEACMDILATEEPTIIKGNPSALRTIFGYVVLGRTGTFSFKGPVTLCTTTLDKTLRSFWESENVESSSVKDPEDSFCEEHFKKNVSRHSNGKYIVRLPFRPSASPLGNNLQYGHKSFSRLEERFKRKPELATAYSAVIQDYLEQGHMSLACDEQTYVLPHHCVYKESSTTAVRVVFDASATDDLGQSLNSRLISGPKLQNDLLQILINFRLHEVALQADIKQMFRNIDLHPDDRKFQRILWRSSAEKPIQQYSLNTVTFGFTSSPYLAQRVLKELVKDEGKFSPAASHAVLHHTFMDDFVTGAPNIEAAKVLRRDLSTLLAKGGFELRKWSSSHPESLEQIAEDYKETPFVFPSGEKGVKILGLLWDQTSDCFRYHVSKFESPKITKRVVLSYIARIWDCLGMLSPVTVRAKLFLQRLWLEKIDWDDPLPLKLQLLWTEFASEMPLLKEIKIPRKIPTMGTQRRLIGFSDASESAMAANVYLHVTTDEGSECHLLIAKTKLAPLKTWTIPRLELSAALLLSKLIVQVQKTEIQVDNVYLFTDSQIVLAWLRIPPRNLKIFVANRVLQILENVPNATWNFVPGNQNPADLGSRGLDPTQLAENKLWWNGPQFLKESYDHWQLTKTSINTTLEECPETKNIARALTVQIPEAELRVTEVLEKFSSLTKLQRVVAYILRFLTYTRKNKENRTSFLSAKELKAALLICVRLTQEKYFSSELSQLRKQQEVPKSLAKLSPFLDKSQLIRAGGRLRHASSLTEDAKHPLILPKNCHLSQLVCDFYHQKLLHAGLTTTLAAIRQQFWIISLRQLLKERIRQCLRCLKLSATPVQPLMGDLPRSRINASRPFTNVAVDFGGPILTKGIGGRKFTRYKSYFCIFVCMAVKAVHIETTTDLSTQAFLAAFSRFVARRGLPRTVYSDCGRNFVGASRKQKECIAFLRNNKDAISEFSSVQGITWIFAPPYGPNFNGLAEAAIKSAKRHLIRQIGEEVLTYEEFNTVLCRIEAVLNSRPLTTLTEDPNENHLYLSPGHFLVGSSLISPPEMPDSEMSLRDRWERIQVKSTKFWKCWSREYLHTLIQRQKWTKPKGDLKLGQIVFISGENLPPLQWPIAKIVALHPGEDHITRVVTVKSAKGEFRRPVSKLLVLPDLA